MSVQPVGLLLLCFLFVPPGVTRELSQIGLGVSQLSAAEEDNAGLQGFGTTTPGGGTGELIRVTNLTDSGPGSLREAVSQGNRRIVFDVAGDIILTSPVDIKGAFITIDGFTAPVPGITLRNNGLRIRGDDGAHDIIVQGLRVRNAAEDGIQVAAGAHHIVVDHVSIQGSGDGNIDVTQDTTRDVTISWSILAKPRANKNMLLAFKSSRVTVHHNIFTAAEQRNPQVSYDDSPSRTDDPDTTMDMRNNLIWGWEDGQGSRIRYGANANVADNFYFSDAGDAEDALIVCKGFSADSDCENDPSNVARAYVAGNFSADGLSLDNRGTEASPFPAPVVDTLDACGAAHTVLAGAGVRPLDLVDEQFLQPIALPPCAVVSPGRLHFNTVNGSADPAPMILSVVGLGGLESSWKAAAVGGSWLSVEPGQGNMPGDLGAVVSSAGLPPGLYEGAIQLVAPGVVNSPIVVPVKLQVDPAVVLSVTKAGGGSGAVTSSPAGIQCDPDCLEGYPERTAVVLTAVAAVGSVFTGWEGAGCSGTAPCMITMSTDLSVTAVFNGAPLAEPQLIQVSEDTPHNISLAASDPDRDTLTFALLSQPAHGALEGDLLFFTYLPEPQFHGLDSFTFSATDSFGQSSPAEVSITVVPVNDVPETSADQKFTHEDTPVAFPASDLTANDADPDGDGLEVVSVTPTGATHGSLSLVGGLITYIPEPNFSGAASFNYTVSDGQGGLSIGMVAVTVISVNDPPVAASQDVFTAEDVQFEFLLTATDAEGDPLTFKIVSSPSHGTLTGTPPFLTYTPEPDFHGSDEVAFKASDGVAESDSGVVSIHVLAVNDPPVADAGENRVAVDGSLILLAGVGSSDPDSDSITFSWTQTAGPPVSLTDQQSATPAFTVPFVGLGEVQLVFQLVVTDPGGLTSSDSVSVLAISTLTFIDPFLCYSASTVEAGPPFAPFIPRQVFLSDQLEEKLTDTLKPVGVCNPAFAKGEEAKDNVTHLAAYEIRDSKTLDQSKLERTRHVVLNPFGTLAVEITKARSLLVPSGKSLSEDVLPSSPEATEVDHYKCYDIRIVKASAGDEPMGLFIPRDTEFEDQFGSWTIRVKAPRKLCIPVKKNEEGVKNLRNHLLCYDVKLAKTTPPQRSLQPTEVFVNNQFGLQALKAKSLRELCIPSLKDPPSPPG